MGLFSWYLLLIVCVLKSRTNFFIEEFVFLLPEEAACDP